MVLLISNVVTLQTIKHQVERDKKVVDLVATMENIFTFVDVLKEYPEKLTVQPIGDTIDSILRQTVETALFIQEYSGRGFASEVIKISQT